MTKVIIRHNSKIPLNSNKVLYVKDELVLTCGYDNVTPSPYTNTIDYLLFKYQFTSTSTTNVGIKVPILQSFPLVGFVGGNLGSSTQTSLQMWDISVSSLPTWGANGIIGLNRTNWTTSSDSNFMYIWTNSSSEKALLSTSKTYWIGINLRNTSNSFYKCTLQTYGNYATNLQTRPYVFGGTDVINGYYGCNILDYNA